MGSPHRRVGQSMQPLSGAKAAQGRVIKKMMPGQLGTKAWQAQFGEALLCVRYREDALTRQRFTTVEVVVDERGMPLVPALQAASTAAPAILSIRLGWDETSLHARVRAAGGKWDGRACVWRLALDQIEALELQGRIVRE